MMESEILYRRLQQHLDRMPVGFPATESGVEIRILKHLFTPAEAEIALEVSAIPEPAVMIHKRVKSMPLAELVATLDGMAAKGVVRRIATPAGFQYCKMMFAVGIYEEQVDRLTPEFERDARQYLLEDFGSAFHRKKTTQMRIVPVNQSIEVGRSVASYDDIRAYVKSTPGPFAKGTCICRKGRELLGEKCRQTDVRESCLTFGIAAEVMVKQHGWHSVSREEMLGLLDEADNHGLVLQPENTQQPLFVCCCCHCCCGVLTSVKQFPRPAEYFSSNYIAKVDEDACQTCGTCETRCQMDAVRTNGKTEVDLDRCIGCGLCVTTCPSEAMHLVPKEAQKTPPSETRALYLQLLRERYGPLGMAKIGAKRMLGMKI